MSCRSEFSGKIEFEDDCKRIQAILTRQRGSAPSLSECNLLWRAYSDRYAAGWLVLPESDSVLLECLVSLQDQEIPVECSELERQRVEITGLKRALHLAGETIEQLQLDREHVEELKTLAAKLSRRLPKFDALREEAFSLLNRGPVKAPRSGIASDRCPRCGHVSGYTGSGRKLCRKCGYLEPSSSV
jgi:hypothetical protein